MRYLVIPTLLFAALVQCGSTPAQPQPTPGKLWNNDDEKVRFMLKMTHHLVAPIKDECIEQVLGRLKHVGNKQSFDDVKFQHIGFSPVLAQGRKVPAKPATAAPAVAAPAAADMCGDSLRSCGTCHLPRVNNCNYRLTIKDKGEFTGKVVADGEKLKFQPTGAPAASEIAPNEIVKTEWIDGGDDIVTWWNFKKLGARARVVKKMMALAAKNNVGCTNCHLQHGNFRLNDNGKLFDTTGEVNRLISIERFMKE
ncbi:MAG: hypothetical protein J0L53_15015 [Spirochaetes bacterium]|nr:hypothetical protein [Spirochaetota bacterium]